MLAKFFSFFIELLKTVAIVFVLAFIIRYFFIQPFIIEGSSMEPDFHDRQLILIDKITYRFHGPKLGDVVVFESPQNHAVYYIKRVIGTPGDQVTIKGGAVYVNNQKISEPYLKNGQKTIIDGTETGVLDEKIPANQYFVLGDNRDASSDSREWGILDKSLIAGRFMVVIYPRHWYGTNSSKLEIRKSSKVGYQPTFQF